MAFCIAFSNKFVRKINYIPVVIFLIFAVSYLQKGGDYKNIKSVSEVLSLIVCYMIMPTLYFYYNKICTFKQFSTVLIIVFLFTTYSLICTIPFFLTQPGMIRATASDGPLQILMQQSGAMNYALPHCAIFVIPALCFGYKYSSFKGVKAFMLLLILETFIIVYIGEATTPLLLGIVSLILSMAYNAKKSFRTNFVKIVVFLLFLIPLMSKSFTFFITSFLKNLFNGTEFVNKINELESTLLYGEITGDDVESRQDLLDKTMSAFLDNPLFGTLNSDLLGGHNYLLDLLASLGLLGFIPLIVWLYYIVKKTYFSLPHFCRFYYVVGISTFLIQACTKNVWAEEFFFFSFFILPCVLIYLCKSSYLRVQR